MEIKKEEIWNIVEKIVSEDKGKILYPINKLPGKQKINRLLIIGNGFDLFHGLQTSFNDFKFFVKHNRPELFLRIEKLFGDSFMWSNFESILGESFERISEIMLEVDGDYYHIPYEDDDGDPFRESETRLMNIRDEIANTIPFPSDITRELSMWFDTIDVKSCVKNELLKSILESADKIITYNYTKTIEEKYGIKDVAHIHGVTEYPESIKFGHSSSAEASYTISSHFDIVSDYDYFMEFGKYKKEMQNSFFSNYIYEDLYGIAEIESANDVIFMGVSFGNEDLSSISEYI